MTVSSMCPSSFRLRLSFSEKPSSRNVFAWRVKERDSGVWREAMELQELLMTALRASVIYVFLLLVIRILGKRTVGNFSAFDLIVALILGEVVDEPIYGDVPMLQAMMAIAIIAAWHFGNSYLSTRSAAFDRLTG